MLRYQEGTGCNQPLTTIADRIADVYIRNGKDGQPTMAADLAAEGFNPDQIAAHGPAAQRIAKKALTRDVADDAPVTYDRVARVQKAAALIGGVLPDAQQIFRLLREENYPAREIGILWPEILAVAGDVFADMKAVS